MESPQNPEAAMQYEPAGVVSEHDVIDVLRRGPQSVQSEPIGHNSPRVYSEPGPPSSQFPFEA